MAAAFQATSRALCLLTSCLRGIVHLSVTDAATSNTSTRKVCAENGLAAQARLATKSAGNNGNGCVALNAGFNVGFKLIVFICSISLPVRTGICFKILAAATGLPSP